MGEAILLKVYTSPTANCQRVTLMLALCGLPYEVHKVDRSKGEQRQPEFLGLNPAAMVPVLVDEDGPDGRIVLAQSGAILHYLATKTGKFLPKGENARAVAMQWLMQVLSDVNPAGSAVFLASRAFDANEATKEFFRARFLRYLGDCDRALGSSSFLAGDEPTIADIALLPVLDARRDILDAAPPFENLKRWEKDMKAMSGAAEGIAAA
jgi:GST-like protein